MIKICAFLDYNSLGSVALFLFKRAEDIIRSAIFFLRGCDYDRDSFLREVKFLAALPNIKQYIGFLGN